MPRPWLQNPRSEQVRMLRSQVAVIAMLIAATSQAAAQASRWVRPKCDLKPGHHLVNSGVLYLTHATDTRFEDQKQKDLRDANRVRSEERRVGKECRARW